MKIGDLVKSICPPTRSGVVLRVFMHKLWEVDYMGKQVNWDDIDPQPFAEVLWSDGSHPKVPQKTLEVISESR